MTTTTTAVTVILSLLTAPIHCFVVPNILASLHFANYDDSSNLPATKVVNSDLNLSTSTNDDINIDEIFDQFTEFLKSHQPRMIDEIERIDGSGETFSRDGWGAFSDNSNATDNLISSGGITRVLQNGSVVEKGACSLTIIRNGKLTKERADTISARQEGLEVGEGDVFSAAALSVVLHTRNPFVPTFRSDVRIFLVKPSSTNTPVAWFGGGSDLTPYYLIDSDISSFHSHLKTMCDSHFPNREYNLSYSQMKQNCDAYFYLPARSEHRGTGGIFFDDVPATLNTLNFVKDVAKGWMPSWLPIVQSNKDKKYTHKQKQWQCLRRGRYLEFNLLYDRGVKFGLANANPRVEGVMVSAPPMIAYEYNHVVEEGSEEERLVNVLKKPKDWV